MRRHSRRTSRGRAPRALRACPFDSAHPSRGPRCAAPPRRRRARRCRVPSRTDRRRCSSSPSVPRSSRRCASRGSRTSVPSLPRTTASPTRHHWTPAGSTTRRCPASRPSARPMAMKNVGGPARNEIRSRATSARACSGSKRRTRTERRPAAPGTRTPLSSPEMCAIGAGIRTASAGPRPCTRAISEAFQLRPRWVCSTALGMPVDPDVNRTERDVGGLAREGAGRHRGTSDRLGQDGGVGECLGLDLQDERGVDLAQGRCHVRRAEGVQHGRRHGADSPAGPGQDGGRQAVGDLPGHRLAAPDAPGPQAAGDRGDESVRLGRREPGGAVDHLATVRGEQGIECGHIPRPTGPAVAPGLLGEPGRSEAGRHGRAPYPGPGNVTPMSGCWREPAWISR